MKTPTHPLALNLQNDRKKQRRRDDLGEKQINREFVVEVGPSEEELEEDDENPTDIEHGSMTAKLKKITTKSDRSGTDKKKLESTMSKTKEILFPWRKGNTNGTPALTPEKTPKKGHSSKCTPGKRNVTIQQDSPICTPRKVEAQKSFSIFHSGTSNILKNRKIPMGWKSRRKPKHKSTNEENITKFSNWLTHIVSVKIDESENTITFVFYEPFYGKATFVYRGGQRHGKQCTCIVFDRCNVKSTSPYCLHSVQFFKTLNLKPLEDWVCWQDGLALAEFGELKDAATVFLRSFVSTVPILPDEPEYQIARASEEATCINKDCKKQIRKGEYRIFTKGYVYDKEERNFGSEMERTFCHKLKCLHYNTHLEWKGRFNNILYMDQYEFDGREDWLDQLLRKNRIIMHLTGSKYRKEPQIIHMKVRDGD